MLAAATKAQLEASAAELAAARVAAKQAGVEAAEWRAQLAAAEQRAREAEAEHTEQLRAQKARAEAELGAKEEALAQQAQQVDQLGRQRATMEAALAQKAQAEAELKAYAEGLSKQVRALSQQKAQVESRTSPAKAEGGAKAQADGAAPAEASPAGANEELLAEVATLFSQVEAYSAQVRPRNTPRVCTRARHGHCRIDRQDLIKSSNHSRVRFSLQFFTDVIRPCLALLPLQRGVGRCGGGWLWSEGSTRVDDGGGSRPIGGEGLGREEKSSLVRWMTRRGGGLRAARVPQ
eukprot:2737817-Pyramimonas_sp.AAC.1